MPTLASLLTELSPLAHVGDLATPVTGLTLYADKAQPGDLFMTVRGVYRDGHEFIRQAVSRGAAAVVGERSPDELAALGWLPDGLPYVQVANGRAAQAVIAAAFYGWPGRRLTIVGVTGTDGKTTTCSLVYGVLKAGGLRVGAVTTVAAYIGDAALDTGFHTTTPDAPDVQRYLAQMVEAGMEVVVLETTSHGLAQHRVDAIDFDVAVITNITHEHLDFHGSYENYREAKATLFRKLAQSPAQPGLPKTAILNADDSSFDTLRAIPAERTLVYTVLDDRRPTTDDGEETSVVGRRSSVVAEGQSSVVVAEAVRATPAGLRFTAHTPAGSFEVESPLLGLYNVSNILAALSVGVAFGIAPEAMQAGVASVRGILGRMDPVDEGQPFLAVVDFAHTPNALEQAIRAGRALIPDGGRVIVAFGSAGLRDREKRRLMGDVAGRLADIVVVTAEDPRTEDLDSIIAESVRAAEAHGKVEGRDLFRAPDRGEAIFLATQLARPGDIVMACGKGHEQSMCFGTVEYPWSDHDALRAALRGAPLRTLPTAGAGERD